MAEESHLSHLSEFQSNLFLQPFFSEVFFCHSSRSFYFCRITFSHGDGLPVANSAPVTILFHTGRADFFFEAFLIFLTKKLGLHSCFDERPWKDVIEFSFSGKGIHLQSCFLKSLFPQRIAELIAPAIETASQPKGLH